MWADGYDKDVKLSEENNEYPFAGYKDVLGTIYNIVRRKEKVKILDIGFGTGVLTKKLYDDGHEIYGIDFSERMIEIAKEKMPSSRLYQHNISRGLPEEFKDIQFDYIISTYAMHHLEDEEKIKLINELDKHLYIDGEIIIGDVAFKKRELLEECKIRYGNYWDEEEIYFVFDELKEPFFNKEITFRIISHCAGIIQLKNYHNLE